MSDVTTVTSENLQDFQMGKLGFPVEAIPESEVIEQAEPETEEVAEFKEPEKQETLKLKKKSKNEAIEERFKEQSRKTREAEERTQIAEAAKAELERKLAEKENPPAPVVDPDKPTFAKFTDAAGNVNYETYSEALAEYKANQIDARRRSEEAEKAKRDRDTAIRSEWDKRQDKIAEEITDYHETLASEAGNIQVYQDVLDAIKESEIGPKILYHLAKNPEEAKAMTKLSVRDSLKALGKLEAKLEMTSQTVTPINKRVVKEPPPPIVPLRGTASAENLLTSDGKFTGTADEYRALRLAGKIK